jgi:hypothetical protein
MVDRREEIGPADFQRLRSTGTIYRVRLASWEEDRWYEYPVVTSYGPNKAVAIALSFFVNDAPRTQHGELARPILVDVRGSRWRQPQPVV